MDVFLLIAFLILFAIDHLLFGLQRTTILLSRESDTPKEFTSLMLPKWFAYAWFVSIGKYLILSVWAFSGYWILAALMLSGSWLLSALILPIPYRRYTPLLRKRVIEIIAENDEVGQKLLTVLDKSFLTGKH